MLWTAMNEQEQEGGGRRVSVSGEKQNPAQNVQVCECRQLANRWGYCSTQIICRQRSVSKRSATKKKEESVRPHDAQERESSQLTNR
jgi:hypothetical protein